MSFIQSLVVDDLISITFFFKWEMRLIRNEEFIPLFLLHLVASGIFNLEGKLELEQILEMICNWKFFYNILI